MVRSASAASTGVTLGLGVLLLGLGVLLLGGCATTQQEAKRLQLNSARLRAAELRTTVARPDPRIRVDRVTVLTGGARSGSGSAVAVQVSNLAARATSDLPIVVRAETAPHHVSALNGASGLDFFQTHLPSIAAHSRLTWVFTTSRRLPSGTHVSAAVGVPKGQPLTVPDRLPELQVISTPAKRGAVQLTIRNPTSVPQYQLQVYGLASAHGRTVAAGRASITHLGTHTSTTLTLRLLGAAAPVGTVSFQAPPTIFS